MLILHPKIDVSSLVLLMPWTIDLLIDYQVLLLHGRITKLFDVSRLVLRLPWTMHLLIDKCYTVKSPRCLVYGIVIRRLAYTLEFSG